MGYIGSPHGPVKARKSKRPPARRNRCRGLVNNAGVYEAPPREIWNVNVRGPWLLTRGLMPPLESGACVVMVTSGMAHGAADAALQKRLAAIDVESDGFGKLADDAPGGYGASKAALNRMAELFANPVFSTGWGIISLAHPQPEKSAALARARVQRARASTPMRPRGSTRLPGQTPRAGRGRWRR